MAVIITNMDIPKSCGDCVCAIYTADEKRAIGYCNTSDEDYYCKALKRFMMYDKVDGGHDILSKPKDCPLKSTDDMMAEIENCSETYPAGWDNRRNKTAKEMKQDILEIINKYYKEDKDNGC